VHGAHVLLWEEGLVRIVHVFVDFTHQTLEDMADLFRISPKFLKDGDLFLRSDLDVQRAKLCH